MANNPIAWAINAAASGPMPLAARAVLTVLADHADQDGRHAFPSVETIQTYTDGGLEVRQIKRWLKWLLAEGLISYGDPAIIDERKPEMPRNKRPRVYDCNITLRRRKPVDNVSNGGVTGDTPSDLGVSPEVILGCHPRHPTQELTKNENPPSPPAPNAPRLATADDHATRRDDVAPAPARRRRREMPPPEPEAPPPHPTAGTRCPAHADLRRRADGQCPGCLADAKAGTHTPPAGRPVPRPAHLEELTRAHGPDDRDPGGRPHLRLAG